MVVILLPMRCPFSTLRNHSINFCILPGCEAKGRVEQFGYTKWEMIASYFKPWYHISVTLTLLDYKQNVSFKVRRLSTHGYEQLGRFPCCSRSFLHWEENRACGKRVLMIMPAGYRCVVITWTNATSIMLPHSSCICKRKFVLIFLNIFTGKCIIHKLSIIYYLLTTKIDINYA